MTGFDVARCSDERRGDLRARAMKHAAKRLARKILRTVHAPRPDPDINPDANLLYAHRCFDGRVERRYPVPAACAPDKAEGLADSIFQPPGFVTVEGAIFDLRKEGVYRFYRLPRLSEQRIVWHGEPDRLLSLLGYLWSYGLSDESMELAEMLNAARRRVLVAGCHNLSLLAVAVLAAAGIRARLVALASLGPWGGQDDGHTLVEVELPETGWILYDPSFNLCFVENGRRISLLEFVQSLRHGRAELERLPGNSGHAFFRVDDFDYGLLDR